MTVSGTLCTAYVMIILPVSGTGFIEMWLDVNIKAFADNIEIGYTNSVQIIYSKPALKVLSVLV